VTVSVPEASNEGIQPRPPGAVFPRSSRLLRHADFDRVYKQGRRHFSTLMTVFYCERKLAEPAKDQAGGGLRVGFTVGRALGGAVQRNRMKRRLREAVRLSRPRPGPGADVVINPKKVVLTAGFDVLLNEVRQAFVVIEKRLGTGPLPSRPQDGDEKDSKSPKHKTENR
jgi:ribonuclease P protein component